MSTVANRIGLNRLGSCTLSSRRLSVNRLLQILSPSDRVLMKRSKTPSAASLWHNHGFSRSYASPYVMPPYASAKSLVVPARPHACWLELKRICAEAGQSWLLVHETYVKLGDSITRGNRRVVGLMPWRNRQHQRSQARRSLSVGTLATLVENGVGPLVLRVPACLEPGRLSGFSS